MFSKISETRVDIKKSFMVWGRRLEGGHWHTPLNQKKKRISLSDISGRVGI